MSLVERALQKIQAGEAARRQATHGPELIVGKLVPTPAPTAQGSEPAPRTYSNRVVKVDRDALRASGLLPPYGQEHEIADQYRAIKRPLIQTAFHANASQDSRCKLIMVASALPGDGKTFTGVNLAFSMAMEKDHTVLLVDSDVAKPHVSRIFGVDSEPGLLDVLADPTLEVESVILPTDVPRLSILPAGTHSETATEFLASNRMAHVVSRLSSIAPRGIVLFDTPPILLTSESRVLTSLMGQIVVVVKAGVTPQEALRDTIEVIGPDKKVWLVLNQAEMSGAAGYFYGAQYGYRKSDERAVEEADPPRATEAT